jgi:hypothetical protein
MIFVPAVKQGLMQRKDREKTIYSHTSQITFMPETSYWWHLFRELVNYTTWLLTISNHGLSNGIFFFGMFLSLTFHFFEKL